MAEAERALLLPELVALEAAYRWRRGEAPTEDEYRRRFPDLGPGILAQALAARPTPRADAAPTPTATAAGNGAAAETPPVAPAQRLRCPHCHDLIRLADRRADEVLCPGCGSAFRVPEARPTTTAGPMRRLGKFQLLDRVGVGAFGAVWRARDTELDRVVALKIPHAGSLAEEAERERFQREARAAAQLRHPGIVTVHEVQQLDGLPALVSDFIDGVSLKDLLEVRRLTFREAAQLVAQVAEAVDYAHQMGLVHRDLKPANIMLEQGKPPAPEGNGAGREPPGVGRPLVMDFGLALRGEAEVTLTLDGHILGTPAYMSPEQAAGKSHQADPRSDVYSLGVILYELLTGELPFRGSRMMILHQVLHEEPRPPRRVNDKVPRDLEKVCLKAMAKTPGRRYATARALAEDLGRFLKGEPVLARPVGRAEKLWRWGRRNPALAAASGLALLAAVAAVAVSVSFGIYQAKSAEDLRFAFNQVAAKESLASQTAKKLKDEQVRTKAALQKAEAERDRAASRLAKNYLDRGLVACIKDDDAALGLHWMARALEAAPPKDADFQALVRTEFAGWQSEVHPLKTIFAHQEQVYAVAFSPDGKAVLTGSFDHTARLWSAQTGQPLGPPLRHQGKVLAVAFSPDGKAILTGSDDRTARLWSVATGKELAPPLRHQSTVWAVAFSPDGKTVLTGGNETAHLWSAATGKELAPPLHHQGVVYAVAFSPDGKAVLTGSFDHTARLWSAAIGQPLGPPLRHQSVVYAVAFRPDGKGLLTTDDTVHLWSAATGKELASPLRHQNWVHAVAFSPDGRSILTGSQDGTARLWSAQTGQPLGPPLRHQREVRAVAFSPDGRSVLTGSRDGTARLWSAAGGKQLTPPLRHARWIQAVAFSPDSKSILTGSLDGTARLWSAATGKQLAPPLRHQKIVTTVAFSPDGRSILTGSWDGTARLWSAQTGQPLGPPLRHQEGVTVAAFSPDGRAVLTRSKDGTVQLWSAATGQPLGPPLEYKREGYGVAFSPDGKAVLIGNKDGTARLWSAATGQPIGPTMRHRGEVSAVAFSPDGRAVLTGSRDGTARLWSAATGKELTPPLRLQGTVRTVAFSPDGKTVLTVSSDRTARLWSAATGKELAPPLRHQDLVLAVAFSPDGRAVLTGSQDGTAQLWSAQTGQPLGPPLRLPNIVTGRNIIIAVAFSPDGRAVLTGSQDGMARLWPTPVAVKGDVHRIQVWAQILTGTEMDDNRDLEVLNADTWNLRRRQLGKLGQRPVPEQADVLAWHRGEATEAAISGQWFAAVWHLNPLIRVSPEDGQLWNDRGQAHAHLEQWEKASADFARASELDRDDWQAWYCYALLCLYLSDYQGYRQACAGLIKCAGSAKDPPISNAVAWACALAPNAVADLRPAVRLAETAAQQRSTSLDILNTLGAALYRAGRYEEAVKRFKEAIAKSPAQKGSPFNWVFLAMAHHQLGQAAEAKSCLKAAELRNAPGTTWYQKLEFHIGSYEADWNQNLEFQILHREAEALLKGSKR